jgi:hypothetical protein
MRRLTSRSRGLRRFCGSPLVVQPAGDVCDLVGGAVDYSVLGSFRPVGVREARRVAEQADVSGRRPVVYCPRPTRRAARDDLGWLDEETPVAVVPDGRLLRGALKMVTGRL